MGSSLDLDHSAGSQNQHHSAIACTSNTEEEADYIVYFGLRVVPDATTAASGGPLLYYQCAPFAILKPKNLEFIRSELLDILNRKESQRTLPLLYQINRRSICPMPACWCYFKAGTCVGGGPWYLRRNGTPRTHPRGPLGRGPFKTGR
jgi:hypothetical protein